MSIRWRIHLRCPTCERIAIHRDPSPDNPRLRCGDCLMERLEVVRLQVTSVEPEEQPT